MIGGLMYITASRPDIAFATFVCARYQAHPTEKHLKEVKRIFQYLRQTRIKRYNNTKPNNELIHYCLQNPPYQFKWTKKIVPVEEGSSETTTEGYMENYKNVSHDIRNQLDAEAEAVQIILIGIDNDIYSTVDSYPNACEMWKAIERFYKMMNELVRNQCDVTNHQVNVQFTSITTRMAKHPQNHPNHYTQNSSTISQPATTRIRGKAIINSPLPTYDQEPIMVAKDDEMSKEKEIDKLMALISLSFKKIYKPTYNNLRTSSNTSRANQDNTPRINKGTRYDNQRTINVAGARKNVGAHVVQQFGIQCYNCKEYGHVARECTVKFGNDQIAPILGYIDLVQGNITIKRVYYVEGLNHNLFSVSQFCDADLEVAFWKSTCYVHDLKGNDLLTVWLWHRRLSHLNFNSINLLSKNDIVIGLPKLKFVKDHLFSSCELGKAKRKSFHKKTTPSSKRRLQLLHMDLCGPMRVKSINGKKYVLVIVDDYSRYTWTHFLRSKDETPEVLIDFLRLFQRGLHAQVRAVQNDKGMEFLNKTLHAYFAQEGIEHQTSTARTPKQNGIVERRNRTLVELLKQC
ncbi:retrovirus-related pol polyprotein from transposon TNT 1-94 [Tanacetum coccineum]|uniref:Retrovirus-related pol polyprotein from transposon TNT 1-94 n=1 Tax=Tanacetum coccineum TaxID=301880 RepID=A0ABQ4ZU28_9ASTR